MSTSGESPKQLTVRRVSELPTAWFAVARVHWAQRTRQLSLEILLALTILAAVVLGMAFGLGLLAFQFGIPDPDVFLSTSVTILATILAIVVSVALLGLQVVFQVAAPSVASQARSSGSWPTVLLFAIFGIGIGFNLWGLTPMGRESFRMADSRFISFSFALSLLSLLYLGIYLAWVVASTSPEQLVNQFARQITSEFLSRLAPAEGEETAHSIQSNLDQLEINPLEGLEQLAYRAIERGERRVVREAITQGHYRIVELLETEQPSIEKYLALSLLRVGERALSNDSPEIAADVVSVLESAVRRLIDRRMYGSPATEFGLEDSIRRLSMISVQRGFPEVASSAVVLEIERSRIESLQTIPKIDAFASLPKGASKEEVHRLLAEERTWRKFAYDRVTFLENLGIESVRQKSFTLALKVDEALADFGRVLVGLSYQNPTKSLAFQNCLEAIKRLEKSVIDQQMYPPSKSVLERLWTLPGEFGDKAITKSIEFLGEAVLQEFAAESAVEQLRNLGLTVGETRNQHAFDLVAQKIAEVGKSRSNGHSHEYTTLLHDLHSALSTIISAAKIDKKPVDVTIAERCLKELGRCLDELTSVSSEKSGA